PLGDLDAQREQSVQVHGTPTDAVPQRRAFQKLHSDERLPVLFADVINRTDVGVAKSGRGPRLPLEPREGMQIPGYIVGQELERDETVEASILSFVNDPHAAAAELLDDTVMRDGLANHGWETGLGEGLCALS